jgi:hypothetical protein
MNHKTCLSCDHYRQEKAIGEKTFIDCRQQGRYVPIRAYDLCPDATGRPGADEAEDWDELPDGEGFV